MRTARINASCFAAQNPGAAREEEAGRRAKPGAPRPLSDFEKEALFQEWVQKSLGTNPDKMDDEAYTTTFEAFKTHMFRAPREEPRPRNAPGRAAPERAIEDEEEDDDDERTRAVDARVKELYRRLVRRLHPDLRADGNAAVSALWHEVQEAYRAGDVARMEILLALSEIAANHMDDATSLAQMRAGPRGTGARARRACEKSLREAEGEDAWNFARSGPASDLRLRVQRQLKSDLAARIDAAGFAHAHGRGLGAGPGRQSTRRCPALGGVCSLARRGLSSKCRQARLSKAKTRGLDWKEHRTRWSRLALSWRPRQEGVIAY